MAGIPVHPVPQLVRLDADAQRSAALAEFQPRNPPAQCKLAAVLSAASQPVSLEQPEPQAQRAEPLPRESPQLAQLPPALQELQAPLPAQSQLEEAQRPEVSPLPAVEPPQLQPQPSELSPQSVREPYGS